MPNRLLLDGNEFQLFMSLDLPLVVVVVVVVAVAGRRFCCAKFSCKRRGGRPC